MKLKSSLGISNQMLLVIRKSLNNLMLLLLPPQSALLRMKYEKYWSVDISTCQQKRYIYFPYFLTLVLINCKNYYYLIDSEFLTVFYFVVQVTL